VAKSRTFSVNYYIQSAAQAAAPQCPYPALINDARAQAGKLAAAAGVNLGPIVSMTQGTAQGGATTFVFEAGSFLVQTRAIVSLSDFLVGIPYPGLSTSACSLTVQFQLGQ